MKKKQKQIIKPKKIENFYSLFTISIVAIIFLIVITIFIDLRLVWAVGLIWSMLFLYLLYYYWYLSKCEIHLDYTTRKLCVVTPFSSKIYNIDTVYIVIKKTGFRSTSYIISILQSSNNKRLFKLRDSDWENIVYILTLQHKSNSITRDFQSKWK